MALRGTLIVMFVLFLACAGSLGRRFPTIDDAQEPIAFARLEPLPEGAADGERTRGLDAPGNKAAETDTEGERSEEEMVRYELAKAEYHGWIDLSLVRGLARDVDVARQKGEYMTAELMNRRVRERLDEIVKVYPETQAAADAQTLIAGKSPPVRARPPLPVLPKGIKASDENIRTKPLPPPPAASRPVKVATAEAAVALVPVTVVSRPVFVYVRSYWRPNRIFVRAHYRWFFHIRRR